MLQYSAERFRQRLAGLETPESRFTDEETEYMKKIGVSLIEALREVFGKDLDRKTLWERISAGIYVSAAKSGNKADAFVAALLEYVRAGANQVVGSELLANVTEILVSMTKETQKQFIGVMVKYRMLLCLQARENVQAQKEEKE